MITLHYAPDNASLILRLALEETRMPYRAILVDRRAGGQSSPEYLRLNPVGRIPAIETSHGAMFETAACLLWITEETGQLAPAPGTPQRPDFLKWLFFISNTLHAELRMLFYPEKYAPGAEAALSNCLHDTLNGHLALLDKAVAAREGFGGPDAPMATDLYLSILLRWPALYPRGQSGWYDLAKFPALLALAKAVEARPAMAACQQAEGLGPTPLSAPSLPTPPEGSAL